MIEFIVVGGPRSATTWMANLLTTDTTLCLHDPLLQYTVDQLHRIHVPGKRLGISCTSILAYPEWLNATDKPKVILYRDVDSMNEACKRVGLDTLDKGDHLDRMNAVRRVHVHHWQDVFKMPFAQRIAAHLGVPFCPYRFQELQAMNIQPQFRNVPLGREPVRALAKRIWGLIQEDDS